MTFRSFKSLVYTFRDLKVAVRLRFFENEGPLSIKRFFAHFFAH
jgi:hypothetical protein